MRRITLSACKLKSEADVKHVQKPVQLDLFSDYDEVRRRNQAETAALEKERHRQEAILKIKRCMAKMPYYADSTMRMAQLNENVTVR